jgi:hypothetical protein
MKKNRIIVKHLVPGIILSLLIGCGSSQDEKQVMAEPVYSMMDDFIIIGYSGPPDGEVTLERYQEIADAGIDILVPGNGAFNREQNLRAMNLAEQVGLKIIPVDARVMPFNLKPDVEIDTVVISEVVKDYREHPGLAAYILRDEPNADLFPALGELSASFRERDPIHEPLINLFPSYGSPIQLGFEDYRSYISSFIEQVKPGLLSYDNYALREGVTWYDAWYKDLRIVREETWKAAIPFIVFVQSQGIREGMRVPNRAEIMWQVNTALCYGARGIGWFSYWTPQPDQGLPQEEGAEPFLVESHFSAMIDLRGERTEVYNYVKEANSYISKAGKGLLGWDHVAVSRWEDGILVNGEASPIVHPSGESTNVVVGTYLQQDSTTGRIVVSNSRCDKTAIFEMELAPSWKYAQVFTSKDARPTGTEGDLSGWRLEAGGSVIIELKKIH